jgi:regulator of protease activity HflC (stomatin/prohibitin superfamily)
MYITIMGKVEDVEESSYTVQSTGEVISKTQLSLVLPSMRERVTCELPLEASPKPATLEQWEMEETWVVLTARSLRAITFARQNTRAGEKDTGALVVFQAVEVHEASADDRKKLQEARKADKLQAKQRRAERRAEKEAAKLASQHAAEAEALKQSA